MAELLISLLIALGAVTATAGLLRSQWDRAHCAYRVYEAVHARLTGAARAPDPAVRIEESPEEVSGTGYCGALRETVTLPRLSPALDAGGALSLPLLLLLLAATSFGFGTWGVMRHWRHLMELQSRLDRCVGDTALELRDALNRIEASNRRIRWLRAGELPGTLVGAGGAIRALLLAEVARQEAEQARWAVRQARWLGSRGCQAGARDLPWPLPVMKWLRPPPDPLGPQPLHWIPGADRRLRVALRHSPRAAAAEVKSETAEIEGVLANAQPSWKAAWAPPLSLSRIVRTNID